MIRRTLLTGCVVLAGCRLASAQGRPLDWPFFGGDAQRTGWQKTDLRITKENIKDFQLVLKRKLDNKAAGSRSLTPPVVIGNLISYKGFKELAFVTGAPDSMWSIDVDTDRMFWSKHFDTSVKAVAGSAPMCSSMVSGVPTLTPPMNFAARPRPAAGSTQSPGAPPSPAGAPAAPPNRSILGTGGFGSPRPAFALSSDGKLHVLNTSTGDDLVTPVPFLPSGSKASNLVIEDGFLYTTTSSACGGTAGVWAMDLSKIDPKNAGGAPEVLSYKAAVGGLAFGTDHTVYVQTGEALVALGPKDFAVKGKFALAGAGGGSAPVVFSYNNRDVVVTAGAKGSLALLDSQTMTPLFQSPALVSSGRGVWGGLSTWQDSDGTRWVLAPVWGAPSPDLKVGNNAHGSAHGFIVAFKVDEQAGKPVLTPVWASRDMGAPETPVITSGIVFALSAGEYGSDEAKGSGHATLYALDGLTGKELYSTASQVTAPGNLTGMTIANGRVYFTTNDNTLWAFGILLER